MAQLAGADFCIRPDDYVTEFLEQNSDLFDGLVLGFVIYYISGCSITAPGTEALFIIAAQISVVAKSSFIGLVWLLRKQPQQQRLMRASEKQVDYRTKPVRWLQSSLRAIVQVRLHFLGFID